MKAIDKLIELRNTDSSIVAIAMDKNTMIRYFVKQLPININDDSYWSNGQDTGIVHDYIYNPIIFDSNDWKECIVTINDTTNYEVRTITISVQEYERLLQSEKTLQNIISKRYDIK